MEKNNALAKYKYFVDFILPESILDYFELVRMEEGSVEELPKTKMDRLYHSVLHIYLDELDNRTSEEQDLRANGFTEPTNVEDFPIRDRKVLLHIRRRRWLDKDGKNVLLSTYPLYAEGTRYSPGLAAFLKGDDGLYAGYRSLIGENLLRQWRQS